MEIGILGAGISGLCLAYKLESLGFGNITILEKDAEIGGLCKTKDINKYIFDISGGKVFNSKYGEVKKWIFSIFPKDEWKYQERHTKIAYKDSLINYPFELNLKELPEKESIKCLVGYFESKNIKIKPKNFYEWIISNFGYSISRKYILPYNKKIWNYDLRKMDFRWVEGKMPIPGIEQIVSSIIKKDFKEKDMPHASFYYPLRGGVGSIINRINNNLKTTVRKNYEVQKIEKIKNKYVVNGDFKFDTIISTMSIKDLIYALEKTPEKIKGSADSLITNSITTTICECDPNSLSWIYLPHKEIRTHRIVFQGNFSPHNTPNKNKSSVIIETIGKIDPQKQLEEINNISVLKDFNIKNIIDSFYSPLAYVVFDKNHDKNLNMINAFLDELGIYRLGRFSERKYNNMDVCINNAFKMAENIFLKQK